MDLHRPKPDVPAADVLADFALPDRARKGRGAVSNRSGRFEAAQRIALSDGWDATPEDGEEDKPGPRTTVALDTSRNVIAWNDSPDIPFDRSVNPYRGCEHGCVYCFARPTHAYLGLSPGLDFETKLLMKPDAPAILARELRAPGYRCETMALGTNTDPYQPVERTHKITRRILEVLSAFNHPVGIVTKSALVERDIDILADMARRNLASVHVSVTTLDRALARAMEPRAPAPGRRLGAIAALAAAGIPTGVLVAPIIPALNDAEIERVLASCAAAGARSAGYVLLRLPLEIKDLFGEWLAAHAPDRAKRVLDLVRETRGGKLYDGRFGKRMTGEGPYAEMIRRRFALARKKLGLDKRRPELDTKSFRPPPQPGEQLRLL